MRCQLLTIALSLSLLASQGIAQDPIRWVQSTDFEDNQLVSEITKKLKEPSPIRGTRTAVPLNKLMSMYPLSIWIDEKALEEESVPVDEPISLPDIPGISIKNQLNLIMGPLNITYVEMPGYLVVTTKKSSANVVRLYDVTSLVGTENPRSNYNYSSLIGMIEQAIEPSEWQMAGGNSTLREWRTPTAALLVVGAPGETHEAIIDLFQSQRELMMQAASSRPQRTMLSTAHRSSTIRRSQLYRSGTSR